MCKMRYMQACECQIRLSPSVNWVEMRFAAARTAVAVSSCVADGSTFLMYGTVSAAAAAQPRITGAEMSVIPATKRLGVNSTCRLAMGRVWTRYASNAALGSGGTMQI